MPALPPDIASYPNNGLVSRAFGTSTGNTYTTDATSGALVLAPITLGTVTGNASIAFWGCWQSVTVTLARSTDGGTTWTGAGVVTLAQPPSDGYSTAVALKSTSVTGAAIYQMTLDFGRGGAGTLNWAVLQ